MVAIYDLISFIFGATYPTSPALAAGTSSTKISTALWNGLIDNINAIGADLAGARGDSDAWPVGIVHTSGQATDLQDTIEIARHILKHVSGESYYYSVPAGSLKVHTHVAGQGNVIAFSAIGTNVRTKVLTPPYGIWTTSLFGAAASGTNTGTRSSGNDVVSNASHNYMSFVSAAATLQDYYLVVPIYLPEDFTVWASDDTTVRITVDYRTGSSTSANSYVQPLAYKQGSGLVYTSVTRSATNWATIYVMGFELTNSWVAGDTIMLYIKVASKNSYEAKVGRITLNYTS
jgi:hypothetical protein